MKDYFRSNITALREVNPILATMLNEWKTPEDNWFYKIKSEIKERPNLVIKNKSNLIEVYNSVDPGLASAELVDKNKENYIENNISVVVGIGLGYLTKNICEAKETKHKIVIIEPSLGLLKEAFSLHDFSKYLKNKTFYIGIGKDETNFILSALNDYNIIEDWYVSTNLYTDHRFQEYHELNGIVYNLINQFRCNIGTVMGNGEQLAINDIANIPFIIRHRGVNELKDFYKGKPAILVSTGPSLEKNIHELIKLKDKVIIIAVAQALRILLAYDITPDFICTVDFGKVNYDHFRGLMDSDVPLIALNRTYDKILKEWNGPKFIIGTPSPGFEETASQVIADKGYVEQGGSVSHVCLGMAIHMGCNPIGITGQDLAYEGNKSHTDQADSSGTILLEEDGNIQWKINDPRSAIKDETINFGNFIPVEGYFGDNVATNIGLQSFITSFNNIIDRYKKDFQIYNCTEGGARISSADNMSLNKFITSYCKKEIDKSKIKPLLSLADDCPELLKKARELVQSDIKVLDSIIVNGESAIMYNEKIKNCHDKRELKRLFKLGEEYSMAAEEAAKKNSLVTVAIYKTSREIQNKKVRVKADIKTLLKNEVNRNIRVERNKKILTAAVETAIKLKKIYRKTYELLISRKIDKEMGNENYKPNLDDVDKYFEKGNWAFPLLEARKLGNKEIEKKALDMRNAAIKKAKKRKNTDLYIEYLNLIRDSQIIGRDKMEFETALKMLKKAIKLFPKEEKARWGLATALHFNGKHSAAEKIYKQLHNDFPENMRYKFEYGNVVLISDMDKGQNILEEVFNETEEFNSFLLHYARLLESKKKYEKAKTILNKYLKKHPANYSAWEQLARVLSFLPNEKEQRNECEIYIKKYKPI